MSNQIQSFISEKLKKEISNFYVFLGGISASSENKIDKTDISIISRITKEETSVVIQRLNWKFNTEYEPYFYDSTGEKSYCYNDTSDIVYLCVGKNQPTALLGEQLFLSTEQPTHSYGIQQYSDGYAWLAMYKIDFGLSKFLTENLLPVNNLFDYSDEINSGTYLTAYNSLCKNGAGITGSCYFYYTKNTKDPLTFAIYNVGDLVEGIGQSNWSCSKCHETGELLGYKTIHIDDYTTKSEIQRLPINSIERKINNSSLDFNDKDYIHYKNYQYQLNLNKSISYLHLDVSSLSIEERIVKTAEPEVIVLDALGIGATAKLKTYYDIRRNAFIANGINLISGGSDYINPSFTISDANSSSLAKKIKAVIVPDISDPSTFLPNPRISVVKKIDETDLTDSFETNQTIYSKVGILNNIEDIDGINPIYSSITNQTINGRTTSKITLQGATGPVSGGGPPVYSGISIEASEVFLEGDIGGTKVVIKTDNSLSDSYDYTSKIVSVSNGITGGYKILEISAADELTFDVISTATTVEFNGINYNITGIDSPQYKLNNSEFVTTKKLSNNLVFDTTTGSVYSTKIAFIL